MWSTGPCLELWREQEGLSVLSLRLVGQVWGSLVWGRPGTPCSETSGLTSSSPSWGGCEGGPTPCPELGSAPALALHKHESLPWWSLWCHQPWGLWVTKPAQTAPHNTPSPKGSGWLRLLCSWVPFVETPDHMALTCLWGVR